MTSADPAAPPTHVAFSGGRRVAAGDLPSLVRALKRRFDADPGEAVLAFEVETGRQVDFDLRGTPEEVLARVEGAAPRGPGRPRLGVTSREVTLLPRHWEWLAAQDAGVSGALRRLVEQAMAASPGKEQARRIRAALGRFLTAVAGDRPGYEEACRALFAGETDRFLAAVARWPKDLRDHAGDLAREAARAEAQREGGPKN